MLRACDAVADKPFVRPARHGGRAALDAVSAAEQARGDSEARLRAVFAAAGTAIAVGDLQGRLTEVNPALAQMLGVPADKLVGREVFEFFPLRRWDRDPGADLRAAGRG